MRGQSRFNMQARRRGQVTVEYFLLLAAIIVISFLTLTAFDDNVTTYFQDVFVSFASDTITQDN